MSQPQKHTSLVLFGMLCVLIYLLSACNMPTRGDNSPSDTGAIFTAAAQTVQAQAVPSSAAPVLTPGALPPSPTWQFLPTAWPTITQPAPPPTAVACDRIKFVDDISIPDDTETDPGEVFVKTWRLQNAGSCTWTATYALVVEGQNVFNAPPAVAITQGSIPPGGVIDVSVSLTAPDTAGSHRGNFKLVNAAGQRFGLGNGSQPFWAQIKVTVPHGVSFDLIARAAQAEWRSGTEADLDTLLTFGGADDDANGTARIKEGQKLESGSVSGKVLATFPQHATDGVIAGIFPPYLVQTGDRLRARLGFLAQEDGTCGAGKVEFQIEYVENTVTHSLGEWSKACDGKLWAIDISLSSLKGKTIQIILLVRTAGAFQDDWAIWNSPRIER